MQRRQSNVDRIKLVFVLTFIAIIAVICMSGVRSKATSDGAKPASASSERGEAVAIVKTNPAQQQTTPPAAFQEGCLTCHSQIEPMHKTASGKLDDGKDGQKLTCTFCHGGNPAEKTNKELAHVQPKYPDSWKRNGQRTTSNPESANTLLAKESYEFVRFINPG